MGIGDRGQGDEGRGGQGRQGGWGGVGSVSNNLLMYRRDVPRVSTY